MPAKSAAQERLMQCAAHKPGGCGGVSQAVGQEFVGDAALAGDTDAPSHGSAVSPSGRAAGILFLTPDKQTLLLLRGDGGDFPKTWGLPGGHQIEGETLEQCARREALEETGLDFTGDLKLLHDDGHFATYLAQVDQPFDVTLCEESSGSAWGRMEHLPTPQHPGLNLALRVALADTELAIAELMRDGVLPSPQIYANIYLVDIRITGTGTAFRSALGEHVYRDPALYLNDEFLSRCNGLPVILDHPDKAVLNADEFEQRISGTCMLPYIKGDEVWSIARIYAKDAIEAIQSGEISTSPAVVFTNDSGNMKITLENGVPLLIEGKPALIDHIALVSKAKGASGVWDKGGPAAGVSLNHEGLLMADETDKEAKAKADAEAAEKAKADAAAKADASGGEKLDKVLSALDSMGQRMDAMGKRMDAMEMTAADKRKDDDAKADKARKDAEEEDKKKAEEKAKADAEAEEKAKADAAKKADEDEGKFADAQARADRIYQAFGDHAPRPLTGESLIAYRRRLAKKYQVHSVAYKDINLGAIADAGLLAVAENQIYADASAAARNPVDLADGTLQEVHRTDATGRRITEFRGTPDAWMRPFKGVCRRVSGINKGER